MNTGQTVIWVAPSAVGKYVISVTVDDQNDANKPENDCGTRDDSPKTFSVIVCCCAHPTNYRQTIGEDIGGGVLHFVYIWDSTSGDLADLGACQVGEIVVYPGGNPYVPPDPPFADWRMANPTIIDVRADIGYVHDYHLCGGGFSQPYTAAGFTAVQDYRFHCNVCMESDKYQILKGPIGISRSVEQANPPNWRYRITKSGVTATLDLP